MKIETKTQEQEQQIDNKLEFLKHMSSVKSRIRKQITEDFIFCKLGEKEKELTVEMTVNAYQGERLMLELEKKAHKQNWKWNEKGYWETKDLTPQQLQTLKVFRENLFDTFMTRIFMVSILNRNVKDNYIIRLLAGVNETDEEKQQPEEEARGIKEGIKRIIKREENA